jgi:ATP/maltotriose-dependent transcriptional regulator MalT
MRATATWHKHAPADDILIHSPPGGGKTTAMRALVSRFEACIASSAWGSSSLWMLRPTSPAIAGHVRMSKPHDTLLWYPTARVASAPDNVPLSKWYIESVIEEVGLAKQCIVAIDDVDLFQDAETVVRRLIDVCRNGGCQLVATTRARPTTMEGVAVIELPRD